MARVSIFLIMVTLIAGMAGCAPPAEYSPSEYIPMVAAGLEYAVGLKGDGTVVATAPWGDLASWNLVPAAP